MRNKYGVSAKPDRTYNGKVYHSKLEMNYRKHLDKLTKSVDPKHRVASIKEQVPFVITVAGIKICTYMLDFEVTYDEPRVEYVDCKGMKTAIYNIKKKLVEALYPIKILEIKKGMF